ncbi:GT4 family glycosyltransferase PelF [Candidatus Sumerlaeota bacterium]|nr:GT4 family glycosyltransferase PelF [Candidatus Sumerlaeota bacterium]
MTRIQVVHVINSMEIGGAQRQVANLFHAIDRERFDMRLVCLERKGVLGEEIEKQGFRVEALRKRRGVDIVVLIRLVRLLRLWQPDIVHTTVFTANLWGRLAAWLARAPIRISHEQSTVSLERFHRRFIDRVLSWTTHRVLTVSEDLRRRVVREEGLSPRKVEVLYNAVDVADIERAAHAADASALPGKEGRRVGVVGRIEYRKDHLTLVRAARWVVSEMPDAAFLVVGDGPDRARIESEVRRLGLEENVHLLGERRDVAALLHRFDLYALSSITEGLSLSILEAMAAGVPVVATRVGGNPELLDDGRCGALVPPGDEQAMAETILRLLNDPAEARTLAQVARERVRTHFDVGAVARRLEEIYERALA